MPRLMHMADVHLGARHHDLGPAATALRERQFAAFGRAIDVALAEKVDLVLICGDLFDSNSQPRRSIERAAGELRRLVERHVRVVVIPGTHDCYDASSIYRVFDLPALAGASRGSPYFVVLTDERPSVAFPDIDTCVHGWVFPTKRAPRSPLAGFSAIEAGEGMRFQVGMVHGALYTAGQVEQDDVIFTQEEIAESDLDYLALGHWHSARRGRVGRTTWAYSGAPEPLALDQEGAGYVLLVALEEANGRTTVQVEPRQVGRTRMQKMTIDAASLGGQADLVRRLAALANEDVVLDARIVGLMRDGVDIHLDEVIEQLQPRFLRLRLVDQSVADLPEGPRPPADTIAGAFVRALEQRIEAQEQSGDSDGAAELREALRLGRLLIEDPQRVALV
ncbi:MAG: DNA repair exonuclease [Chloroflexota bacterium]|nr:DNA repair exonuclease [Chloroflexota bacterium]